MRIVKAILAAFSKISVAMLMQTNRIFVILETTKSMEGTMARKTKKQQSASITGKIVLILFGLIILIGTMVLLYIHFTTDMSYQPYYEIAQANEHYLIENQAQIVEEIEETQVNPQQLGHVFIPEEPANYIDIQHVTQHNVPYINQNDPRWANKSYGTDASQTIWENGCAIVVLAMVDSYYTHEEVRPEDITRWAGDDYYMSHQGTSWSIYSAFGQEFGYDVIDVGNDFYSAVNLLEEGYLVVVSVGPGTFTEGGHVMLMRGYQDGLVYLNDPNDAPDKLFSIQGIHAQTVIDDALNYWAIAPY